MKKKTTNALLLALSAMALLSCQSGNGGQNSSQDPLRPTSERTEHLQSGSLHDVVTEDTGRAFVQNGSSAYHIYYESGNTLAQKAAAMIATHVDSATGVLIPVSEADSSFEVASSDHVILLGLKAVQQKLGVPVSTKDIGTSGYQIETLGDSYFIRVEGDLGYQQAAIAFLKAVLGYTRYSASIVTYTKDGSTIPTMHIVEKPDYAFRTQSNKVDPATAYEMGFLTLAETFYTDSETQPFHNSFDYLPKETYFTSHQKWYSDKGNQICYTAHGDKEEYQAMIDTVYEKMVTRLAKDKTVGAFTFSIQDNPDACTCSSCKNSLAQYGADSGAVIRFCNALDDKLQAYLQKQADQSGEPKRELNLLFFAYHKTEKPCATKQADGTFVANSPDVVCNPHVGPYIAPISASFTTDFYDESNEVYADSIRGWGALSNKLYLWFYETNFSHYLYPLNTYASMIESYRFGYENHGMYMFNEGQHNQGATTCFGRFKEYFNSIALFNVNTSYTQIVDDFFSSYFGPAEEPMKKYFNELQEQFAYIQQTYSTDINGTIYNNIAQARFWPKKLLDRWVDYIEEAKEDLLPLKQTDRVLYENISDNLTLESIFPRYALLNHYSGKYSAETLQQMRLSFKEDCQKVNVTMLSENTQIDSVFSAWDL